MPPGFPVRPVAIRTNQMAVWSLVLGVFGLFCCSLFTGIPALLLGYLSRRTIIADHLNQTGERYAVAGIWLGIASIVLFVLLTLLFIAGIVSYEAS